MPSDAITIPSWAVRVAAACLPVIVALAGWANLEIRNVRTELGDEIKGARTELGSLRDSVTVLNVQMDQAIKNEAKLETLRNEVHELQRVVDRLEGRGANPE